MPQNNCLSRSARSLILILPLLLLASVPLCADDDPTLAVLPVFSQGVDKTRVNILQEYIIDQVNRTHAFTLVERTALDKALKEIDFSMKEIIDDKTAARIGKISGARYILISSISLAEGTFYLSLRVVETETARIKNTAIKTTDSFKNVELLTAEASRALLDLGPATVTAAASTTTVTAPGPVSKKLWGNSFFIDDRNDGGASVIETGIAKDETITMKGVSVPNPRGAYLIAGFDLDAAGLSLMKKTQGIRFKATGDNHYYRVEFKTADVKDYNFHHCTIFMPDRETDYYLPFTDLVQGDWGKQVPFNRAAITGLQVTTFSHKFVKTSASLTLKDFVAVTDDEKPVASMKRALTGTFDAWDDAFMKGTSKVSNGYLVDRLMLLEGKVTTGFQFGYIGMSLDLDQAGKERIAKAKGITFKIAGDGRQFNCGIKTPATAGSGDYHGLVVTADKDFKIVTLLFKDIKQSGWGKAVPFDRTRITGIQFMTVERPLPSVRLEVAEIDYIPE
jgi:hypothetical protein